MLFLDKLEFNSPLVEFERKDGSKFGLKVTPTWQRRLRVLWDYIQQGRQITDVAADRNITRADMRSVLLATGTITLILPSEAVKGDSYYVFNNDVGVITIAGTINGNAAGYQLTNPYQYAEFTNIGVDWIVTINN